ncbi:McrB family protein [Candidatus Viridilinea mediisalina]|uniref:GTPase n=1 Tax=Candidatus Viridilinea mediisalina TaxID=2024553 RepID=A0A2A6RM97_9CHLR|nr:AAA family ATPase [Candidatus Viridilinea mediisalina]PDW04036.1 GTPase [Candidatus Viridilinea mediisalina]
MIFSTDALAALSVPGVTERWQAVQAQLHPQLAALATEVATAAQQALPRQWPLYEVSYKSQRAIHRGPGRRVPINDYWVAFDRPPRGAGVLLAVSAAEQALLVGLQLWGSRKPQLARLWELARPVWLPLIERIEQIGQARFAQPKPLAQAAVEQPDTLWIERYLAHQRASYLWAGFVYPWDALPPDLTPRLIADVLALLPLNEALMEQVEAHEPLRPTLLREHSHAYAFTGLPPIELLVERMRARGFTINELTLRSYHVALQTRPLVILPGISGTGKTRLTRLYADAVYDLAPGRSNPYYLLVAVQPDWHNARDLLGYYNALTGSYHATPCLRFLLQAAADPQQPYYLCLDELNLARPEYYLAPLLSAMETSDGLIDLGTPTSEVPLVGGGHLQNPLRLPLNLRIIGTVNVDESTFALSDKLLDRANVIELTDVDLAGFRANYPGPLDEQLWATLVAVHQSMAAAGHAFGYRTIGDILRFIEQAQGTLSPSQALDLQLKQRILPRLRGEEGPRLRRALNELLSLTLGSDINNWQRAALISTEQLAAAPYPASAARLRRMLERLDQEGFSDFYG